ncbi:hypothetical protein FACS1894111_01530 [Clostridia bacterium]|nr:hypothetical protein FACS1894111_01530 [Clostridia bacterium]
MNGFAIPFKMKDDVITFVNDDEEKMTGIYDKESDSVIISGVEYKKIKSSTGGILSNAPSDETTVNTNVPNSVPSEESETANTNDANEPGGVFSPQDVSDETIKSIKTYPDYLAMYRKIIEDYFANYELAVKGTLLYSEENFASMKQQYDDAFESQKKMYESFGNAPLMGKDSLVDFLISYRDGLKEVTDGFEETLKSLK